MSHRFIDLQFQATGRAICTHVVDGWLVDPGPASSLPALLAGLGDEVPRGVLLTHIHLDHAGGTGSLLEHFGPLPVYVHERGARHLIDPSRLLASAERIYGDQMQMIVPSFLEQSMIAFSKEQERFREQMKSALGKTPMDMMKMGSPMKAIEEQARRNIDMFQNAMRMFSPFPAGQHAAEPEPAKASEKSDELKELKSQIAAMQRKIDSMG